MNLGNKWRKNHKRNISFVFLSICIHMFPHLKIEQSCLTQIRNRDNIDTMFGSLKKYIREKNKKENTNMYFPCSFKIINIKYLKETNL